MSCYCTAEGVASNHRLPDTGSSGNGGGFGSGSKRDSHEAPNRSSLSCNLDGERLSERKSFHRVVPEELAAGGHDETQLQDEQIVACSTHRGKRTWIAMERSAQQRGCGAESRQRVRVVHGWEERGARGRSVGVGLYVSLVIGMLGGICVHKCAAQSAGINK